MADLFIYLLKVSAAIALVALPYYLVIRSDANLFLKRIYLAGGILLSWTFPLLTIRKPAIAAAELPVFYIYPATVPGTGVPENISSGASLNIELIFAILYLPSCFLP